MPFSTTLKDVTQNSFAHYHFGQIVYFVTDPMQWHFHLYPIVSLALLMRKTVFRHSAFIATHPNSHHWLPSLSEFNHPLHCTLHSWSRTLTALLLNLFRVTAPALLPVARSLLMRQKVFIYYEKSHIYCLNIRLLCTNFFQAYQLLFYSNCLFRYMNFFESLVFYLAPILALYGFTPADREALSPLLLPHSGRSFQGTIWPLPLFAFLLDLFCKHTTALLPTASPIPLKSFSEGAASAYFYLCVCHLAPTSLPHFKNFFRYPYTHRPQDAFHLSVVVEMKDILTNRCSEVYFEDARRLLIHVL